MKKRLFPIALACILAIGTPAAAFAETGDSVNAEQKIALNDQAFVPDEMNADNAETIYENEETETIDEAALAGANAAVETEQQKISLMNVSDFAETDKSLEIPENLELQSLSDAEMPASDSAEQTAEVNHAPIAGLQHTILNPESLIDGKCTRDTELAFFWKWDNTLYTYDIDDGDEISVFIGGVPLENCVPVGGPDDPYEGFVVLGLEPGEYDFIFYAEDSHNARSNVLSMTISVVEQPSIDDTDGIFVQLPNAGDSQSFDITLDHSQYPNAMLLAYAKGGKVGDVDIEVWKNGTTKVASTKLLLVPPDELSNTYFIRNWCKIENASNETVDYTIVAKTGTGNAACEIKFVTEDSFVEEFSGKENAATLPRNTPIPLTGARFAKGRLMPLNGEGEWFRYTAQDKYTYFTTYALNQSHLTLVVMDAETGKIVKQSNSTDRFDVDLSPTLYAGYVQTALDTTPGHDYLIRVYSDTVITGKSFDDFYNISVGVPYTAPERMSYKSPKGYNIPANKTTTLYINVDADASDRLAKGGNIRFVPENAQGRFDMTMVEFTAPNGRTLKGEYGFYIHQDDIDYENYLTSRENVKLQGLWVVTVKSSKALSDVHFYIVGAYSHIYGNYGN